MGSATEEEFKEKLLWNVKREVKQVMEEAVTKKFVHEDSSHVIALCKVMSCRSVTGTYIVSYEYTQYLYLYDTHPLTT
ncbi:small G protein signaling modulator 2 isoform X1 [Tachysurus ichikawai]